MITASVYQKNTNEGIEINKKLNIVNELTEAIPEQW
jgi:hypothetical protein